MPKNDLTNLIENPDTLSHKHSQIILKKAIFNNEDCDNLKDTYINVDVTISGCQSINKKISFVTNNQDGNTIKITNSIFIFNSFQSENAMLIFQGTLLDISNITIKSSSEDLVFSSYIFDCSNLYGSTLPTIDSLSFIDCHLDTNISIFKLTNYPGISFTNLCFEGENIQCKSFLESDSNSSVEFTNCSFSNFNEHSTIFALNFIKSELHFNSCNFFNNKCSLFHLNESNSNLITFDNCHFFNNKATNILSFIYLIGKRSTETIEYTIFSNCLFSNNSISSSKPIEKIYGTIVGFSTSLHFEGTNKFTNCHTTANDTKSYGGGLTIVHLNEKPYELENCTFKNCSATNMGGGFFSCIMFEQERGEGTTVLHLTNCNFSNCWSFENGGGLSCGHSFVSFAYSQQTELKIKSSLFKECKSPVGGGIFFKDQTEIGFEQTYIDNTIFDNCQGKNGTALFIRSDYFTLISCQFINHYTDCLTDNDDDECNRTFFYLNTAHLKTSIQIKETVFKNNSGQSIEIYSPSTMQMATINNFENCQFIENNKFVDDHTLINCECVQSSITGFTNCSFINNRGKCIYSEMTYCIFLSIGYSKFIGNYGSNGACLCAYSDSLEENELALENNELYNNTVNSSISNKIHGGIVSIRNVIIETAGKNEFKNNRIVSQNNKNVNNNNDDSGASLFIELTQAKSISLSLFTFENCFASKSGGAVFVSSSVSDSDHKIKFFNCSFINNVAEENGGALLIETKGLTKISIEISYFNHNLAKNGGSIYINENSSLLNSIEFNGLQFFDDEATISGGSIYLASKNNATIKNCNFTQTKAKINGMAISIDFFSTVVLKKINLLIDKEITSPSALYVFSSYHPERNDEIALEIDGGCFLITTKNPGDKTVDFLIYNVSQTSRLIITGETCFQKSKEESILIVYDDKTSAVIDDSAFNCDKCNDILPVESTSESETETESESKLISETETELIEPTETNTDDIRTLSYSYSIDPKPTQSPDDDGGSGKKLGFGTIIGITLIVFTAVCIVVIIVIYIIKRRRSNNNDNLLHSFDYNEKRY